jgi:hypothetical protein
MLLVCAVLLTTFADAQLAHQPLTNESIVTLAKAGFDELFILELIRHSRTNFDTTVEGLIALKKTGVSEDLIRMMVMPPPPAPAAKAPVKKHGFLFKRPSKPSL